MGSVSDSFGFRIANRSDRLKAAIWDAIYSIGLLVTVAIIFTLNVVLSNFFGTSSSASVSGSIFPVVLGIAGIASFVWLIVFPFIQLYQINKTGQTWGKMKLKIRIMSIESGKQVSIPRYIFRESLIFIPNILSKSIPILSIVSLIDIGWIMFDKNNEALHDKIAKTRVIVEDLQ